MKYHWQDTDGVIVDGVDLAQYDLVDVRSTDGQDIHRGTGIYKTLEFATSVPDAPESNSVMSTSSTLDTSI